jgi:photosystem II stability/assembly factor-like uncharacterized protein
MERNLRWWTRLAFGLFVVAAMAATGWADQGETGAYQSAIRAGDLPESADGDEAESPMGRIDWMKERMGGELSAEFRAAVLEEVAKIQAGQGNVVVGGSWTSLGPTDTTRFQNGVNKAKHDTGRLRAVLPHPTDGNTVYVLTSGGGLWKTTNFSAKKPVWVPKTDGIYATAGGSAAFGRTPNVLYVGTGDPFDLGVGGVVFTSTDGANSWNAGVALPTNPYGQVAQRVLDVKVDASVGANQASDIVLVGTDAGLYRSTDGGATFAYTSVDPGLEGLFAGFGGHEVWSFANGSAGWLASQAYWQVCSNCYEQTIVYVSGDGGATWSAIPDPEGDLNSGNEGRTTLAIGGPGDSVVYALSGDFSGGAQYDVYRSTDGGLSWTGLGVNAGGTPTNPNIFNSDLDITAGQAWYNQNLLVDPDDSDKVYVGGQLGSAASEDGGQSWTLLTSWLGKYNFGLKGAGPNLAVDLPYVHADHHCGAISTASGKTRIYFGGDGGLFYSEDDGKSWSDDANYGVVSALIYALASGTKHSDNTLIGLQDNGTRFRISHGTTWTGSIGGDGFGVGWSQANDDYSMGSLYFLDIRRWKQNPPNNQSKYDVLLNTSNLAGPGAAWYFDSYFVTPIATPGAAADPTGGVFFTNTRSYLLRTDDGGDSWSAPWDGTASPVIVRSVSHGIGLSPNDLNHIGLAGSGGNIVYTHNGGGTWSTVLVNSAGIPSWPGFNSSVGIASDNTTMYLVSESTDSTVAHVAKSSDGGASWGDATGDLPKLPINKVVVDPADASGNTAYVANWIGVYETTDGGGSWSRVGTGLPFAMVSDLYFPPDGSFLRISSYGRGVWEMSLN